MPDSCQIDDDVLNKLAIIDAFWIFLSGLFWSDLISGFFRCNLCFSLFLSSWDDVLSIYSAFSYLLDSVDSQMALIKQNIHEFNSDDLNELIALSFQQTHQIKIIQRQWYLISII